MILTIILIVLFVLAVLMALGVIRGNPLWLILAMLGIILLLFIGGVGLF